MSLWKIFDFAKVGISHDFKITQVVFDHKEAPHAGEITLRRIDVQSITGYLLDTNISPMENKFLISTMYLNSPWIDRPCMQFPTWNSVAQLVEHCIRNTRVKSSKPRTNFFSGLTQSLKRALSRIIRMPLNCQNTYLCHRKPTNNGPFLLTYCYISTLKLLASVRLWL